ncbi:hypothetical protein ACQ4PT_063479 [Festuca glaucescens]
MQPDRAPGPDGFSGGFYQRAWPIIKRDIMAAVLKLFVGDGRGFGKLNGAIITLIPKRLEAVEVGYYRPISLVHSFAKLFSKILANRLRPKMHSLVSMNQSAFIKGRNLHDKFMLVRQLARKINSRKEVGVLLKLDISRAFDSLSWSFLFEVLRHLGFPEIWLRWVAIALRSATTRVLVNGVPGRKIYHARGLRQGDPLSPQLFVLMMEVATCLIRKAVEEELFSPIGNCTPEQRLSIYADDVVLFVKPNSMDLMAVREILGIFGEASGLRVNYLKTSATMIRGTILDKEAVGQALHCNIVDFPIRYLGLQLALRPLTKAQWQPMLDAAMHIMPAWQRGMISRPGRLTLVKAVITARPVHHLLVLEVPCWVLEELEKNLRGFFWAGKEKAHGGQCLVAWQNCCKPYEFGGLNIKNMRLQGLALRVRWQWLSKTNPNRPWQGLPMFRDTEAMAVCGSLMHIKVGDGRRVLFWRDRWINGRTVEEIAPSLFQAVNTRTKNSRTVEQALLDDTWVADALSGQSTLGALEGARLWMEIRTVHRDTTEPDEFTWPSSIQGQYTAKDTYDRLA